MKYPCCLRPASWRPMIYSERYDVVKSVEYISVQPPSTTRIIIYHSDKIVTPQLLPDGYGAEKTRERRNTQTQNGDKAQAPQKKKKKEKKSEKHSTGADTEKSGDNIVTKRGRARRRKYTDKEQRQRG